jgi:hypothetical protein
VHCSGSVPLLLCSKRKTWLDSCRNRVHQLASCWECWKKINTYIYTTNAEEEDVKRLVGESLGDSNDEESRTKQSISPEKGVAVG